ncbi:hypothetical protein Vadar_031361 [Vaccinium darrowii]|uniref:Uncharacterized protein n=1 Tax=Vaccinium darrowii TaxID=229202 RepID=A0ACB7YBA4_9ERIC|nr:hypothetical protein Vadar_031361 [Vaccinium darrowii]
MSNQPIHIILCKNLSSIRIRILVACHGAAWPTGLRHHNGDILVPSHGHRINEGIHHLVEQVPVPEPGDRVITEVKRGLLKHCKADGDPGIGLGDVVGPSFLMKKEELVSSRKSSNWFMMRSAKGAWNCAEEGGKDLVNTVEVKVVETAMSAMPRWWSERGDVGGIGGADAAVGDADGGGEGGGGGCGAVERE